MPARLFIRLGVAAAALSLGSACSQSGDRIDRSTIDNVVVITMDTTRADRIGAYGYEAIETPAIDAMAAGGVLFEDAITAVPLTLPSHTTIFTGQYPLHHGVRNNGSYRVPAAARTMAEILKEHGFRTGAFIGAYVLDSKYGLDQGFDVYDDDLHGGTKAPMFMFDERPARMVVDRALDWLQRDDDRRFFVWLHFFDPHANYAPPPPFDVLYDSNPYEGEIAYVDSQIARLLEALRNQGRLDSTLIVLTSDHGEGLGEHGEKTHSLLLHDATVRVPLIMRHPHLPQGTRVQGQVRTVDILPTALDLLRVPADIASDGVSLAPAMHSGTAAPHDGYIETLVTRFNHGWAELRGVRTSEQKYVHAPRPELYDLATDPAELDNLYPRDPDRARSPDQRLAELLAGDVMRSGADQQHRIELSATDRERLAALGYQVGEHGVDEGAELPDPKDRIVSWEQFHDAQQLVRERRFDEAKVALEEVLADDPGHVLAHGSLASVLLALGETEAAKRELETVTALDPRRNNGRIGLARIYQREGDMNAAFDLLKEALEVGGNQPEVANQFADLFQRAGNTEKAIEWYRETLRRDPLYIKAYVGLSDTYHRAGRETEARETLEKALEIDPRSVDALYNLGVVAEAQDRPDEAATLYRRALEVEPTHAQALNNLGGYYDRKGDTQRARSLYRRVLAAHPSHYESVYNLGTLLLRDEQVEEAIPILERATQLGGRDSSAANNLIEAYRRAGRGDRAVEFLEAGLAEHPERADWWYRMALVEASLGETEDATQHLAKAIELGGDPVAGHARKEPHLRELLEAARTDAEDS